MNALSDPRKGYVYFADILKRLKHKGSKRRIKFAVIGHEGEPFDIDGTPCIPLGTCFSETDLASLYCVGDIYIFPSIMDNLANTLKEATCCGLPCVAFDIGGNSDMITHGKNGFLIPPFDTKEFAKKIIELEAMSKDDFFVLRENTQQMAHNLHSESAACSRYHQYYEEVLRETNVWHSRSIP